MYLYSAYFQSYKRKQRFVKVHLRCFSFLQRYWWRLNYFVIWRRVYCWIHTYVSEDLAAYVFVVKEDSTASSSDTSITLIIDTASCPTRLVHTFDRTLCTADSWRFRFDRSAYNAIDHTEVTSLFGKRVINLRRWPTLGGVEFQTFFLNSSRRVKSDLVGTQF